MYYFHVPILSMEYSHHPLSQRSSSDLSKETLLEKDEYQFQAPPQRTWRRWVPVMCIHGLLITIYTAAFLTITHRQITKYNFNLIDTPARPALQDTQSVFDYYNSTKETYFATPPTSIIDDRWDAILDYGSFKFSAEEMARWGRLDEGVLLTDNSGYMGTLNVFHDLHCLKRIYMYINKDAYYGPMNLSNYEQMMNHRHTMHCLDGLRQATQCRIDATPVTFKWKEDQILPIGNFESPHECKNWDTFMSWAKKNSFDPLEPGLVVNPKYGAVYAGEADVTRKIGIALNKNNKLDE